MSRFDKYDPVSGGFRAPLNAAITSTDVGKIQGFSINTSGRAVVGGPAETAVMGLAIAVRPMAAGEPIDIMTNGEIVDCLTTAGAAFTAGQIVYTHAAGTVDAVATAGKIVAKMIDTNRMVVRCPVATT